MSQVTCSSKGEFMMISVIAGELAELEKEGSNQPGVKVSAITKKLKHSMPATSKMLNGLEDNGYINRITSKEDRRAVYINLTESGREKAKEITESMDEFTNRIMQKLGDNEAEVLITLLRQMYGIMEEEVNNISSKKVENYEQKEEKE